LACAALVPFAYPPWTHFYYTPALSEKFAPWRAEIPPHAEVIWPDNPVGSWYLLSRPSYWSPHQVVGAIFSREKSALMRRRTTSIQKALEDTPMSATRDVDIASQGLLPPMTAQKLTLEGLRTACSDPDLSYVVSWLHLRPTPSPAIAIDPAKPNSRLYLYRCSDL
jgi:hypothetical protein